VRVYIALPVALTLILVVGCFITWWWYVSGTPGVARNMVPVLDKGQLQKLLTYKRRCRKQSDCEAPLLCVGDNRWGGFRCLASECETDNQCEPGFRCTPFVYRQGPVFQLCLVQGTQREGERCEHFHLKENRGCQPGLVCDSGFCGRPCDPNRPSTCPEGSVCHREANLPACLPSCLKSSCPPETQCIRIAGDFSVCATVRGRDCDKQPCPPGEECQRELGYRWQSQVVKMWCASPCNEKEGRLCPAGWACLDTFCTRLCGEGSPETCPLGEQCTRTIGPEGHYSTCRMSE